MRKIRASDLRKIPMSLFEGWDARAWDKKLHYFVRNRGICSFLIRYHPPYFNAGYIPPDDAIEIKDYCKRCLELLRYRVQYVNTRRFII